MKDIVRSVLFLTLMLTSCSAIPTPPASQSTVPQSVSPASPSETFTIPTATALLTLPATTESPLPLSTTAVPDSRPISTLATPHIDQGPDGPITQVPDTQNCGYQWAYQDLPELSSSFQQSLQALQPEAQGTAFAYGENCILPDGSIGRFLPMETDFNVTLQASDLNNESELGDWIVKVMQVITEIPPEQIVGPQPGRVSLTFQSGAEQKIINFYINQYQGLPPGLSPVEIFQALQMPQ
jgi:hypothetical protein